MIEFKTYEEQLKILTQRNLSILNTEKAITFLKINNYYNVINAYKDLFLIKGHTPETFKENSFFEQFITIFNFDKNLRNILLNYLLKAERLIKAILSYEFAKNHPEPNSYLNIDNYDTSLKFMKDDGTIVVDASQLVTDLSNKYYNTTDSPSFNHYKSKYNSIPIWVFINTLSFSNVGKMYAVLKNTDKTQIAKAISDITDIKSYGNDIQKSIKILALVRNKCAHDYRIYNLSIAPENMSPKNEFLKTYNCTSQHSLFSIFGALKNILPIEDFNSFLQQINSLIIDLRKSNLKEYIDKITSSIGVTESYYNEYISSLK